MHSSTGYNLFQDQHNKMSNNTFSLVRTNHGKLQNMCMHSKLKGSYAASASVGAIKIIDTELRSEILLLYHNLFSGKYIEDIT